MAFSPRAAALVHRDLKPQNIFLHEVPGGAPVVKVLDFGIAKSTEFPLTQANQAFGTPQCMSPEQCQSEPIDGRSDLYAVGCLLFEMVSGQPPFCADDIVALILQHVTKPAPGLRDHARTPVSDDFVAVVVRALNKKAADRYPSAVAMCDALRACATPLTSSAVPAVARRAGTAGRRRATGATAFDVTLPEMLRSGTEHRLAGA